MENYNMDRLVTVSIANIIPTGAGFGVVIGTGANCMIPSRVVYAADLHVGDLISCRLVENPKEEYRLRTPFMVSYVDPNATAVVRAAVNGGAPALSAPNTVPEQLNLPFREALQSQVLPNMDELLSAWDDDDPSVSAEVFAPAPAPVPAPAPAPAPAPKRETSSDVRDWVRIVLDSGGMWTLGQLRDYIWPNDEFGSDDYRYKLLTNAMRDLHISGEVGAVGRRNSMHGILTAIHYTKQPNKVRFVWED